MRKIFLDNLPRYIRGSKEVIDWKNSVGYKVEFIYEDIKGIIEIVDYISGNQNAIKVKFLESEAILLIRHFKNGHIGRLLNVVTSEFKLKIGDKFKDDKRDLILLDREYRKNKNNQNCKYYKYKCNKCGWNEGWIIEDALLKQGIGCSCCYNRTAVLGINTIWDTDRWMCDLGVLEEDAKKYTKSSSKKVLAICPNCNKTKEIRLDRLYKTKSLSCICGDGYSYCEKFFSEFLRQMNIDYKTQITKTTLDWIGRYMYDFYFEVNNKTYIVETHGVQHYEYTGFNQTLEEVQKNDKDKEILAKENKIDGYIVVNCKRNTKDYIKNSILNNNDIIDIFGVENINNIDWDKCEKSALNNLIKEVCEYWNNKNEKETTVDLARIFGVSHSTINTYLKKGNNLGFCEYDVKKERIKATKKSGDIAKINFSKQIEILKDGISLGIFNSITELCNQSEDLFGVKLNNSHVSRVCNGLKSIYKGYTFRCL